jgi:hypothetical protein
VRVPAKRPPAAHALSVTRIARARERLVGKAIRTISYTAG